MMTDTKTLPPDTDEQPPQPKTKRLDMSGTQLVGGAFAAMTAAVIGAQLGVAGTVLGAAIGSVVAGTAGSLYTASLKHTQTKIASAFIGRVGDTPVQITTTDRTPDEPQHGRRLARRHPAERRRSLRPPPTRWPRPPRSTRPAVPPHEGPGSRSWSPRWPSSCWRSPASPPSSCSRDSPSPVVRAPRSARSATVARAARTPHARFPPRTPRRSRPPSPRPHRAPSPAPNRRANQVRSPSPPQPRAPALNRPPAANPPPAVSRQPLRRPPPPAATRVPRPATTPVTQPAADSLDPTAGKR